LRSAMKIISSASISVTPSVATKSAAYTTCSGCRCGPPAAPAASARTYKISQKKTD
jgi:hypothetical protein